MVPHPDFRTVALPRSVTLGDVRLTPLSPDVVDEDLAAVQASAALMDGIFGDVWPTGLTREDNLIDLAWHEREFTARRSFSWIIRDQAGAYIGCFYVFPAIGALGRADAVFWLCPLPDREAMARTLQATLSAWLEETLPSHIEISWRSRPVLAE